MLGLPMVAIGVVWFLVAMLVPYCDVMGIPAVALTALGVYMWIPRRYGR